MLPHQFQLVGNEILCSLSYHEILTKSQIEEEDESH